MAAQLASGCIADELARTVRLHVQVAYQDRRIAELIQRIFGVVSAIAFPPSSEVERPRAMSKTATRIRRDEARPRPSARIGPRLDPKPLLSLSIDEGTFLARKLWVPVALTARGDGCCSWCPLAWPFAVAVADTRWRWPPLLPGPPPWHLRVFVPFALGPCRWPGADRLVRWCCPGPDHCPATDGQHS